MSQFAKGVWIAGVLLALCGRPAAAGEEVFKLVVGSWCPFECTEQDGGELRGFMTDIAVEVLAQHGVKSEVVFAPYRRGVQLVMENQAQVVVGIARSDAPGLVFPELEQGLTSNTFFVRAGDPWQYQGMDSLAQRSSVGIVGDFDYDELSPFIAQHPHKFSPIPAVFNDHGSNARRNIEKLLAGRVDAIVHDSFVTEYELRRMGKSGQLVAAGSLQQMQPLYIAFSPLLPGAQRYAEQMSEGMRALRESGKLAKILERYGLRDWKGQFASSSPAARPLDR